MVLRVEQIGEIFDVPVTVTLQYADRKRSDVVVPVTEPRASSCACRSSGVLRGVEISKDDGTLARDRQELGSGQGSVSAASRSRLPSPTPCES